MTDEQFNRGRKLTSMMYNTGNYVVRGTGGWFWANESHRGCLIEACSSEDISMLQILARENKLGVIYETKTIRI